MGLAARQLSTLIFAAVVLCCALARGGDRPETPSGEAADPHAIVRGMTISCQTWGGEWGTDDMVAGMRELKALGVNWITIHPYASIRADGSVVMWRREYGDPYWLTRPIAEAHKLGLKIMIKPHLAYWGSPFDWRGEIAFQTDEQWANFFETYERWIVKVARICEDADAFVIGTELDKTIHHEQAWRGIIAELREAIDAPLTYSANWTDYERVPFWDALDAIGIQSYFPLTDHDRMPEPEELKESWRRLAERLNDFAAKHDRKVILAELGYNRSTWAAKRPWEHHELGRPAEAEETQRRCLTAALETLKENDRIAGAFLWKWFVGPTTHENFLQSTTAMREVIKTHWGEPNR